MTQAHHHQAGRGTQGRNQHADPLSPRHGKPFHNPTTSVHSPELLNVRCVRLGRSLQVFSPSRTLQRCPKRVTIIMSAPANTWPLWCRHRKSLQCIHKHVSTTPQHSRTNKETTHKHDRDHVFLAVRLGRSLQLFSSSRTLRRCPKRVTVITPTFPTKYP